MSVITIAKWQDIPKIYEVIPEIIVFNSLLDIPSGLMETDVPSYEKDSHLKGVEWVRHAPFPFPSYNIRDNIIKELKPLFELLRGGRMLIFKVSPSKPDSMFFATGCAAALYWLGSHKNPDLDYYFSLRWNFEYDDKYLPISLPIGKTLTKEGHEVAIWTRLWTPSLERLDGLIAGMDLKDPRIFGEALLKISKANRSLDGEQLWEKLEAGIRKMDKSVIEKGHESISEFAWNNIKEALSQTFGLRLVGRLRMLSDEMRAAERAWPDGDSDSVVLAKDSLGFPTAFALKFGSGAVVLLPDTDDMNMLLDRIEEMANQKRLSGFSLVQEYCKTSASAPAGEECVEKLCACDKSTDAVINSDMDAKNANASMRGKKYVIELKDIPGDKISQGNKPTIYVSEKPGMRTKDTEVTVHQFLKFAGFWAASILYGGYSYTSNRGHKAFIKIQTTDGEKEIPGIALFRNIHNEAPVNILSDKLRCLEAVFKDLLEPGNINEEILDRPRDPSAGYIRETIKNVTLVMGTQQIESLRNLRFKDGALSRDYELGKADFFKMLTDALSKAKK